MFRNQHITLISPSELSESHCFTVKGSLKNDNNEINFTQWEVLPFLRLMFQGINNNWGCIQMFISRCGKNTWLETVPGAEAVQVFSLQPPLPCSLFLPKTGVIQVWGKCGLLRPSHCQGVCSSMAPVRLVWEAGRQLTVLLPLLQDWALQQSSYPLHMQGRGLTPGTLVWRMCGTFALLPQGKPTQVHFPAPLAVKLPPLPLSWVVQPARGNQWDWEACLGRLSPLLSSTAL